MDIRMPILNGLEATRQLREENDPPHVIVLTTFDADDYVLEAIAAGADGFILKDTPPAEIVAAIRKVAAGEPMLSPSVTRSEEHTSELQSLMRISYAVFCLKKKTSKEEKHTQRKQLKNRTQY